MVRKLQGNPCSFSQSSPKDIFYFYISSNKKFEVNKLKLIVISGAKNSKKDLLAHRLASNSDCIWIKPYSDRTMPINADPTDSFIRLNTRQLNDKMMREVPLAETVVKGNRYVFFENQLKGAYCVIVGDDRIVFNLKNNYESELVTIRCHSDTEKSSPRFLLGDEEFDYVFNYDHDDYDTLEALIV